MKLINTPSLMNESPKLVKNVVNIIDNNNKEKIDKTENININVNNLSRENYYNYLCNNSSVSPMYHNNNILNNFHMGGLYPLQGFNNSFLSYYPYMYMNSNLNNNNMINLGNVNIPHIYTDSNVYGFINNYLNNEMVRYFNNGSNINPIYNESLLETINIIKESINKMKNN
jgi:hypothetical protein